MSALCPYPVAAGVPVPGAGSWSWSWGMEQEEIDIRPPPPPPPWFSQPTPPQFSANQARFPVITTMDQYLQL